MKLKLWLPLVALFGQILGCSYDAAPHAFEANLDDANHVIYGDYSMEELRKDQPYRQALVSLFDSESFKALKMGEAYLVEEKFGGKDLPWSSQLSLSYCSGILIEPDLVLTAGHCLSTPHSCKDLKLVFNYSLSEENKSPEVRSCKQVVKTVVDVEGKGLDYALIRLNKPVDAVLPDLKKQEITVGESIYALGDPLGSFKKKSFGEVRSWNEKNETYITTLDVFEGNSGSPVFSINGDKLIGILSGGEMDFTDDGEVKRCANDECTGETVIPLEKILTDSKK